MRGCGCAGLGLIPISLVLLILGFSIVIVVATLDDPAAPSNPRQRDNELHILSEDREDSVYDVLDSVVENIAIPAGLLEKNNWKSQQTAGLGIGGALIALSYLSLAVTHTFFVGRYRLASSVAPY